MRKLLASMVLLLFLSSCKPGPDDYHIYSDELVDGHYIYMMNQDGLFCNHEYEDIYYSGETYNYGFSYEGCDPSMAFFIKIGEEFIFLGNAIDDGIITLDSLMPLLQPLPRHPEVIESNEADYYWMDFYINHDVVYVYAGGECDQSLTEEFIIDNVTYTYTESGCMNDHILYMKQDGSYVPVADLLDSGDIEAEYIIPMLTEVTD